MFNKQTFCSLPWSTLQIMSTGDYKICMFSGAGEENDQSMPVDHGLAHDENGNVMNVLTHSMLEALNSQYHKQIRLSQAEGKRDNLCRICWDRDDAMASKGQPSNSIRVKRSFGQFINMDNAITLTNVNDFAKPDGSLDEFPISLDLRLSNQCNMKCIMCSPKYSSLWYEDELKLYGRDHITVGKKTYPLYIENGVFKTDIPNWNDSPIWWQRLDEIKHRLRHLYISGGEPFLIKAHDIMLQKLIDADVAKNIVLEYDTNLTVINDNILTKLKQFKNVLLFVSCDDIEDKFELIRFPGKFNKMLENLEKIKSRGIKVSHISSCVGMYSIFSPIRLEEYFNKLGYNNFSFRFLRTDPYNIAYLPDSIKKEIIKIYEKSNISNRWKGFICGYLENNMNKYEDISESYVNKFTSHMDNLDNIRGTNWKKTFPEVSELLIKLT